RHRISNSMISRSSLMSRTPLPRSQRTLAKSNMTRVVLISIRCWRAALPVAILLFESTFHPSFALAAPQGHRPPAINNPTPGPPIGLIAVVIIVVALSVFLIVVFSSRGGSMKFLVAASRISRFKDYHDLRNAAEERGFHVTHDIDGVHNANSLHYK